MVHKNLFLLNFYCQSKPAQSLAITPAHMIRFKRAGVGSGFGLEGGMVDFEARRKVFADVGRGGGARDDGQSVCDVEGQT